ncbi:hypothetical protein Efla_001319 [Eimeria flavescens]
MEETHDDRGGEFSAHGSAEPLAGSPSPEKTTEVAESPAEYPEPYSKESAFNGFVDRLQSGKAEEAHAAPSQQNKQPSYTPHESLELSPELNGDIKLPEPRAEDLFDWERLTCDPPYRLQGDDSFETPEKQAERQALKSHPQVTAALKHVHSLFAKDEQNRVMKTEYARVLLRICLVLVPELRGREVVDLIEDEWLADSKGEEALSPSAFFDSFFELADIWTPGIDAVGYAEFLRRLFRRITIKKAQTKPAAKAIKIRPKIVVKVLNQSIRKPESQEKDQEDAQRVELVVGSDGNASFVAEWSKADHEAVEAMMVAHICGETRELDRLDLQEEVLDDCPPISPKEPVSTEWAEFANIAPMGAASRAFLESVFSNCIAKVLQPQQQQQREEPPKEELEAETELQHPPPEEPKEEEQVQETHSPEASEPPVARAPAPFPGRHFAGYNSISDLSVKVQAASEEELRPFNSIGLPVQLEGKRKLVRLKAVPCPQPQHKRQEQPSQEDDERQPQPEAPPEKEDSKTALQVDESQTALLRDLQAIGPEEPPLEELKSALSPHEEENKEPALINHETEPEPPIEHLPEPQQEPDVKQPEPEPEPETAPDPEAEPEPELQPETEPEPEPDPDTEPHFKPAPEPEPEPEPEPDPATALDADEKEQKTDREKKEEVAIPPAALEESPSSPPRAEEGAEAAAEPSQPIPEATDEIPSPSEAQPHVKKPPGAAHRPKHFSTRVFHSLREESLRQIRVRPFRESIIITGVGTVAVRRRSDSESFLLRHNRQPLDGSSKATCMTSFAFVAPLAAAALIKEEQAEEDPWHKAYAEPEKPAEEQTIVVTEENEVAFAQQPRQAIIIVGPNGPEKSRVAYNLATNLGLEWLQAEYLLSALCKINRNFLTPLGRRLTRVMSRGSQVPVLEALLLTLEFMASKRSRSAGYVLELPAGEKQDIRAFFRHLRDLSGRSRLNWPALLLRHARICEQRRRRRGKEKRQRVLQVSAVQRESTGLPPSAVSLSDSQKRSPDGNSSAVQQLLTEAVGGIIEFSGGQPVSDPQKIAALRDLAKRPPPAVDRVRDGLDSSDSLSSENDPLRDATSQSPLEGPSQPSEFKGMQELSAIHAATGPAKGREVLLPGSAEQQKSAIEPAADQGAEGDKENRSASDQEKTSGATVAPSTALRPEEPENADEMQEMEGYDSAANTQVAEADDPGAIVEGVPVAGADGSQSESEESNKSSKASANESQRAQAEEARDTRRQPQPIPDAELDSEVMSADLSDSDSEADAVFQKAAEDPSQPQPNPLMDAFPGRAVFLLVKREEGSRPVMVDTTGGDLIDEFNTSGAAEGINGAKHKVTVLSMLRSMTLAKAHFHFVQPLCWSEDLPFAIKFAEGKKDEDAEEEEEAQELTLDAKTDVLEEIRKAVPPNFEAPSQFEVTLSPSLEDNLLSQRLLLQQLLQVLGPDRVIYYSSSEGDYGTGQSGALEAEVALAGSRIAAALEFLSARPPGEVAVAIPGAPEADSVRELLQRADLLQQAEAAEVEADNEAASDLIEEKAETEASPSEGDNRAGPDGQESEIDRRSSSANFDKSLLPPLVEKKYLMADDLWGESQLESDLQSSASRDKEAEEENDALCSGLASSTEAAVQPQADSSPAYSAAELQQLFDRRWTLWGSYCPVSLKEGKIARGQKQFAVDFAGKIFLMANEEAQAQFIKDPKRYTDTPPCLPPRTFVYLFGPSYAGVSKQARLLSRTYGFVAVDVELELGEGHKRLEEQRQRQQEEAERLKEERLMQERLKKQKKREEEERQLMEAEDKPQRLAMIPAAAADEPPLDDGNNSHGSSQSSRPPAGECETSPSTGSSCASPEAADAKSCGGGASAGEASGRLAEGESPVAEDKFLLTEDEEKALKEGQTLGTATIVRLVLHALGILENLGIANATEKYRTELEEYEARYGAQAAEGLEELAGDRDDEAVEDFSGTGEAQSKAAKKETPPPPPTAPPPLSKPARGLALVCIPPTQELLEALSRVGISFDHLIHITNNPSDVEEAEAAGATQFAFRDSEIIFEDESEDKEIDPAQRGLEKEIDEALILDIEVEPVKIDVSLTDLMKHYRIRQLLDPFIVKPDEPENVKAPPNLEEVYQRIEYVTSFEVPPDGEEWENAAKTFPFLPRLPLVLYGDVGPYCPVALRDERWLLPGKPRLSVQVRQRVYCLFDEEKKYKFEANTRRYLPSFDKCSDSNETSTLRVPPPRIAFLGCLGSHATERVKQLSDLYAVPVLDLAAAFPAALLKQLRIHLREEKRAAVEEAMADLYEDMSSPIKEEEEEQEMNQLLSLSSSEFIHASPELLKQSWSALQEPMQQALCREALKTLLHPLMGPAFIQGEFASNPATTEEGVPASSVDVGELMNISARLPDCVVILLCSDDVAVKRCINLRQIDKDAEKVKRQEAERRLCAKRKQRGSGGEEAPSEEEEGGNGEEGEDLCAAPELAREAFLRKKMREDAALLRSAKSFAKAGVPVLTIHSELCDGTLFAALKHFLDRFMNYRRSLLLSPQCIPLPKASTQTARNNGVTLLPLQPLCQRLLRARAARLSKYDLRSPMDVDSIRKKDACEFPVFCRDRIYFPGDSEEARKLFCRMPSKFLTGVTPPPREFLPACVFLGPLNSNRSQVARQIAELYGALYVSPLKLVKEAAAAAAAPTAAGSLSRQILEDLQDGKPLAPCCISSLVGSRLRSPEAKQRGFVLDGCGLEGADVQQLLELLHATSEELAGFTCKHERLHGAQQSVSQLAEELLPQQTASLPPEEPAEHRRGDPQVLPSHSFKGKEASELVESPDSSKADREGGGGDAEEVSKLAANVKALVPPLQLVELSSGPSADALVQYRLPTASSKASRSAALADNPTAAGGDESSELSETCEAGGKPPAALQERCLVDAVFLFSPEEQDLFTAEERLLKGEAATGEPSKRLRYPYGDDRDVLCDAGLAEERRRMQRIKTLQQVEAFSSAGASIIQIPADSSEWLQFELAHKTIENLLRRRHTYERLTAQRKAARCPLDGKRTAVPEGPLAAFCPVCLTVNRALLDCREKPEFQLEFKAMRFFCCSEDHLELVLQRPEAFVNSRLPALLPRRCCVVPAEKEQQTAAREELALKGFCPVSLVDTGELVRGDPALLVAYGGQTYSFANTRALGRFMLHPASYSSRCRLPPRLTGNQRLNRPPTTLASIALAAHARCVQAAAEGGDPGDPLSAEEGLAELRAQLNDALAYIEISTVDVLMEALLFAGKKRLLHPHFSQRASVIRLVASFLEAKNPLAKGHFKADAEKALADFVEDCETPFKARQAILHRHLSFSQRGLEYLPQEQMETFEAAEAEQLANTEWSYLSELQYTRLTQRLDRLFHLEQQQDKAELASASKLTPTH